MGAPASAEPAVRTAPTSPAATYSPLGRTRVDSVDLLRGLVMVIMMLDHTRDFVHGEAWTFDPTDLTKTYPLLFFTRWITHFCAAIFVFLAGTGAYFQEMRGKPKRELSGFLVSRGIWLVVLELTVVRLGIFFNPDYSNLFGFLQVIWAIGWSMIVLAALIQLPLRAVAGIGIGMIALHNLLDGIEVTSWRGPGSPTPGFGASVWSILHQPGVIFPFGAGGPHATVLYPLIPWIGVMAAGYSFGSIYRLDRLARRRLLLRLGSGLTLAFIALRAINIYGDPSRWAVQKSAAMTVVSFLNATKYPPSLLFLLMTLGPALLALAWYEKTNRRTIGRVLVTYGRVPLFFYVLQWLTAHTLAIIALGLAGKPFGYLVSMVDPPTPPVDYGFSLPMVYALWILGVVLLYPLCKWYAGVKARRRDWWLSYL